MGDPGMDLSPAGAQVTDSCCFKPLALGSFLLQQQKLPPPSPGCLLRG